MATVTIDAEQYERMRLCARLGPYIYHTAPGDLDPIEPDPEPSVEAMLDALVDRHLSVSFRARGDSDWDASAWGDPGVEVRCWSCKSHPPAVYAPDWRSALRAAYAQVVGEEG